MTPVMYSNISTRVLSSTTLNHEQKDMQSQFLFRILILHLDHITAMDKYLVRSQPNKRGDIDFDFNEHENYNLFNAHKYSNEIYDCFYSKRDDRTKLGIYLELQAHYVFDETIGIWFDIPNGNPTYLSNPKYDSTAKLFEAISEAITNPKIIDPIFPIWWR